MVPMTDLEAIRAQGELLDQLEGLRGGRLSPEFEQAEEALERDHADLDADWQRYERDCAPSAATLAPEPTDAQLAEDERMVAFRPLIGMVEPDPGVRETETEVQARFPDADADEVAQAVREVNAIRERMARDHDAAADRLGRQRSDLTRYRAHLRAKRRRAAVGPWIDRLRGRARP